ncbi:MAG: exodeoxyribonuclease VII large subunit, partial [Propionibacteriaceae bacterium]|nr:exodeoxyribonuclease VII large subunit [Propionibacteriaceae bacterium]
MSSSPQQPQPLRVVVAAAKSWVERLGAVWVEGQITEIKRRTGQLQYLTLRDGIDNISVSVVTTAVVLDAAGPIPEGTMVAAWVKPQLWTTSGKLVFDCREIRPIGEGQLLAAIEQRKRMLQAEGLFATDRKKRLKFLPAKIGLITGAGSAAERDVVENTLRRWPAAVFEIAHTLVQGSKATQQIVAALEQLDSLPEVEVIVIARGGGSTEDLLPFSDEALIRAVFATQTPVVSAIGHDIDTPILDLVADVAASTPTDAAKHIVPNAQTESEFIISSRQRLREKIHSNVDAEISWLADLRARPVLRHPRAALDIGFEQTKQLQAR